MAKKVVLAGACRTAIGTMGGSLSTTPAAELGAIVIKEALNRAGVAPEQVDQVYMGCVIQAGLGQNVARQASIKAGLPIEVPAVTMNVVCGSGLNCVNQAAQMILAGDADIVVAGGMENMSMAPYAVPNARFGYRMNNGTLVDTMVNDALWDAFNQYHMIKTADNICEEWGLTREELDEFALKSQQKAEAAQKSGAFDKEIVPVMEVFSYCYGLCCKSFVCFDNFEVFDLHACLFHYFLCRCHRADSHHFRPYASQRASHISSHRLNAQFFRFFFAHNNDRCSAVVNAGCISCRNESIGKDLGIDVDKQLNPNGGAIALGHPVGASGCRILVTLLHEMEAKDAKTGLATLCIGGGMGCATVVTRE